MSDPRTRRDCVRLPLLDWVDAAEEDELVDALGQAQHEADVGAVRRQFAVAAVEERIGEDAEAQRPQATACPLCSVGPSSVAFNLRGPPRLHSTAGRQPDDHRLTPPATTLMSPAVPSTAVEDLPAIVLGSHVTGLGVVRCLGLCRIPAYLVSERGDYAAGSAPWARRLRHGPPESSDPAPLARFLESVPLERALLLPCSDDWTRAVAALPAELRERFPAPIAPLETIEQFVDKQQFAALVELLVVPHPRTAVVRRIDPPCSRRFRL